MREVIQKDKQTNMKKRIVAFRNFWNAPRNGQIFEQYHVRDIVFFSVTEICRPFEVPSSRIQGKQDVKVLQTPFRCVIYTSVLIQLNPPYTTYITIT
jgi:hypothetical protein